MNGVKAPTYLTWGGQLGNHNGVQTEAWCEKVSVKNALRPLFAESGNLGTMSSVDSEEEIAEEIVDSEEEMQANNHQAMHLEGWCEKVSFENAFRPLFAESDGAEPMNVDIQPSTQPQELNLSSNTTTIHSRHDNNHRPLTRSLKGVISPKIWHAADHDAGKNLGKLSRQVEKQARTDATDDKNGKHRQVLRSFLNNL